MLLDSCNVKVTSLEMCFHFLQNRAERQVVRRGMARKKNLLEAALDLPAFLLGVFCLYWSLPLSVLLGRVQFLKLYGKRDDAGGW